MSAPSDNVARIRARLEAWDAGDFERFESYHDEDIVMHHPPGWPEPGPSVGAQAVQEQFRRVFDVGFGRGLDIVVEPFAVGEHTIGRARFPMQSDGGQIRTELSSVDTWRDGRIVRTEFFWDHDEALRTAGLDPQAP